ncbi:SDR family oxidoreductase [Bdellovibrio sp. HCB288]|uniref:SDR family oxidoreductase n=1 Tax=Bdellovibrio sp. HCB288 TaxID=3394355 RepID=UPI0039B3E82B
MWPFSRYHKKNPDQPHHPVVLITGCSKGIGLDLARLLYKDHPEYRIVATAREKSIQKLHDHFLENDRFVIYPLDVTQEESRIEIINHIHKKWGGVDILVNNAGISYRSVIEHMTAKDELLQMETNYLGPMGLIRRVLPYMRETGRGKIINVSSVAGMLAMPTMSSYSASKYALEGASESLWYEMRPFGVQISLVQPGFVNSESFMNVYHTELSDPANNWNGPYCDFYQNMTPFVAKMMQTSRTSSEQIAKIIIKTMKTENPPLWIPATLDAKVFYYIRRLMPRRLLLPFLYWCLPKAQRWGKNYSHRR